MRSAICERNYRDIKVIYTGRRRIEYSQITNPKWVKTKDMSKKMTNRQVEMFARIHVAVRASYFDAFGVAGTDTTNEDKERLVKAVQIGRAHV